MSDDPTDSPAGAAQPNQPDQPDPDDDGQTVVDTADDAASTASMAKEICAMYLAALGLIVGCVVLAQSVALVAQNLYVIVAAIFVGLPYVWLRRRGLDFDRFGLTWERAGRGVLWGLGFAALTVGPFAVGYWWWETQWLGRQFEFAGDNFLKWPVDYEHRPGHWGKTRGVWVWSDGPELHIGMRAGRRPVAVDLDADSDFEPTIIGPASARAGDKQADENQSDENQSDKNQSDKNQADGNLAEDKFAAAKQVPSAPGDHRAAADRWTIRLDQAHTRAEVILKRHPQRGPPRDLAIRAYGKARRSAVPIYRGQSATKVASGQVDLGRGLWWIVLWVLTQVVFIALPEEFFYRGYLQTRLGQAVRRRRRSRGRPADGGRWWQISAENGLTSLLFAAGHVLVPIGGVLMVSRASVFFPALAFGWLRERTDTIAAPVTYHAAANLMVLLAAPHFF